MTDTPNLGLPYIDGSQAQKHVTHNEALRILDAAIQIGVLDLTLTEPPSSPAEGERHVVASGATGAWAGQDNAIATWQDGAWAFLAPKTGWCIWSAADSSLFVFDGAAWQSAGGTAALDDVAHLGVNTAASSPNLLSVKSNAALFAAIDAVDGGTGDVRLQVSKESSANTASIFFSDSFSGRAEFGLVGADAFKLKVSPDGSTWTEAFTIDQDSGNLTLPRGLALTGVVSPAQITADQSNYNPTGLAASSVLQVNADAARSISGLAGGTEGRCLTVINVGSQPVSLLDESASSSASNRFSLAGNLTISAKQAAILRYDGTAARWQAIAGGAGLAAGNNLSDLNNSGTALTNLGGTSVGKALFTATDAAAALAALGSIGDYVSASRAQASEISLTSSTQTNVTSISLTAGDWDVWGTVAFDTASSTVVSASIASISTTSATLGSPVGGAYVNIAGNVPNTVSPTGTVRLSLASITTVYLVAYSAFTTNTQKVYGFIGARRVR